MFKIIMCACHLHCKQYSWTLYRKGYTKYSHLPPEESLYFMEWNFKVYQLFLSFWTGLLCHGLNPFTVDLSLPYKNISDLVFSDGLGNSTVSKNRWHMATEMPPIWNRSNLAKAKTFQLFVLFLGLRKHIAMKNNQRKCKVWEETVILPSCQHKASVDKNWRVLSLL